MAAFDYTRSILQLDDTQLERFSREWIGQRNTAYFEVTDFSGAGDRGRDIVGFISSNRHEGEWHNYQCKQYSVKLPTETAIAELGKILYYAHLGEFSAPEKYYFVVPRGINRNLAKILYNPTKFKECILDNWDKYCRSKIISNTEIPLTPDLKSFIGSYDFSKVSALKVDHIVNDVHAKPVLFRWFGADPGPAPKGRVPEEIQSIEHNYVKQLIKAYGEREKLQFSSRSDLENYSHHKAHFAIQRERFFHADAFKRFYRDNTSPGTIEDFENDIYFGIVDTSSQSFADTIAKIDSVMSHAAKIQAAGPLAQHAHVPVKQGICHHFANANRITWTP